MVLLTVHMHDPMSYRKCYWPCKRARPPTQIAVRPNFHVCTWSKLL